MFSDAEDVDGIETAGSNSERGLLIDCVGSSSSTAVLPFDTDAFSISEPWFSLCTSNQSKPLSIFLL